MLLVPCTLAIVAGVFPVCYAMMLSRSRAERRLAIAGDVPLKRYRLNESKELTAPKPVLKGLPPNLAMLNPVIDPAYAANYESSAPAPAGSNGTVEQV